MIDPYVIQIVDDEEQARKSLAFLLTTAGFAVRTHETAAAFLAVAPHIRNGCLLTDLRMPDISGVELLRCLQASHISMPAIVITGHGDVPMAVEAMKAGALDFIEKPFEDEVLIEALEHAVQTHASKPAGAEELAVVQARLNQLSERERQVLSGVVSGLPNKTIAYELDISPRTVEAHRASVMAKMQARSLPELVRMTMAAQFDLH